ncbi:hypothetical protein [Nitrosopumilus sp. K4]|uniref:hypothetical protein n=1 Tax=Nitrosopumilus sp. K4 TaxID=2795383 RepID=UPI0020137FFE|nr:hypothetical protein [Nitrosopumilus sp. K4]
MQNQCFIELSSFNDFARFVCAFREYPLRVFSHDLNGTRVLSSNLTLANTLVLFYTPMAKFGRYISYQVSLRNEICDIVESTKNVSTYAPIIHMENDVSPLTTDDTTPDVFHPVRVQDLGSLARLTYNPEFPEEPNLTLYALPHNNSWILGYITSIDMDEVYYQFNYVELDSEPLKPFVKYQGHLGKDPEFSDSFEHGFSYMPIIKIKSEHKIFGFENKDSD